MVRGGRQARLRPGDSESAFPARRHVTIKHPVGVVGAISPWNFPITLQSRKIAPALAAGCTVVSKPASQTPLSLVASLRVPDRGRAPAGVVNLVMGSAQEIADELLENPICRKISFTGSTEVGKQLMKGCADQVKRVSLELGGHAPFIVFPDADPGDRRQDRRHGQVPQQRPGVHRS